MKIRNKILNQMYRNQELVKAIAFALYIKERVVSSSVPHYTINKLHSITGVSAAAIKKRIKTLTDYGLVEYTGTGNNCIVFKKICSKCDKRNIRIKRVVKNSLRDIEKSLRAMLVVGIQARKNYASRLLLLCHNGRTYQEVKEGKSACRHYGYNGEYFIENGLSYAGIAKRLGVSLKTAFETVKYAIKHCFLRKQTHFIRVFIKNIGSFGSNFINYAKNSFFTQNNWYEVHANTYSIHPSILHGNN